MDQFRGRVQDLVEDCSDLAKSHGPWTLTRGFLDDYWEVWGDVCRSRGLPTVNFVEYRKNSLMPWPNFRSPRSGLGWETGLNLQSSISTKPAAWKTKKTRAIGLSPATHIWNHVDAVAYIGGSSIMSSELLQRQAETLRGSTLERIFVVRGMQAYLRPADPG